MSEKWLPVRKADEMGWIEEEVASASLSLKWTGEY